VSGRCIIVDDSQVSAMVAWGCAKAAGLETRVAHSCAEFRTIYPEFLPDIVISDIVMPDEDGLDVLRFLWSVEAKARIILVSANEPKYLELAQRLGESHGLTIAATFQKPFDLDIVRNTLQSVTD